MISGIGNWQQALGTSEWLRARPQPFAFNEIQRVSSRQSDLNDAAAKLVSSALVMPAMASLQDSTFRPKDGPFAAGAAERRFAPLLHAEFADRVTKAANFGLVKSVIDKFGGRSQSTLEIRA